METIKYRVIVDSSEENIIVTDKGDVACIRETFDGVDAPRIATTEYYQMPLTEVDKSRINNIDTDVWCLLGEGKMYYDDWNKDQVEDHNDPKLIEDCLQWFYGDTAEFVRDDTIQTDFFPID